MEIRHQVVVCDAADHRQLAEFYRALLGAQYRPGSEPDQAEDPRFIELRDPATGGLLAFQVSENHQSPDWPDHRRVLTQAHLDIDVPAGSLDQATEYAVSLDARVLSTEEHDDGMVVLADPAGHPFCLLEID